MGDGGGRQNEKKTHLLKPLKSTPSCCQKKVEQLSVSSKINKCRYFSWKINANSQANSSFSPISFSFQPATDAAAHYAPPFFKGIPWVNCCLGALLLLLFPTKEKGRISLGAKRALSSSSSSSFVWRLTNSDEWPAEEEEKERRWSHQSPNGFFSSFSFPFVSSECLQRTFKSKRTNRFLYKIVFMR